MAIFHPLSNSNQHIKIVVELLKREGISESRHKQNTNKKAKNNKYKLNKKKENTQSRSKVS